MDSHSGCHSGWLEPLLERVAQDRGSCVGDSIEVVPCPTPSLTRTSSRGTTSASLTAGWKIYYQRDHFIRQSESPNIGELVRLKKRPGCRNFHWFLTDVYPDLYIPQDRPSLSGELYNVGTGYCVDYPGGWGP
ncbi:polypeptide N-acetylgalactosaminyltransferase 6-like [Salmo trutta]|uniref:polypeptide N-acetylgalactosaminyltransferase 6-like n=1 Tax=Salmo trutta TaxID=8032 RepID=UPI001130AE79|nr:polypeptide N-acetylgalactosaminyltransferase 6-like [Salmo trutta]